MPPDPSSGLRWILYFSDQYKNLKNQACRNNQFQHLKKIRRGISYMKRYIRYLFFKIIWGEPNVLSLFRCAYISSALWTSGTAEHLFKVGEGLPKRAHLRKRGSYENLSKTIEFYTPPPPPRYECIIICYDLLLLYHRTDMYMYIVFFLDTINCW